MALAEYSEMPANRRMPSILNSIKKAKEYRQAHPVAVQNDKVAKDIKKAFDLVE